MKYEIKFCNFSWKANLFLEVLLERLNKLLNVGPQIYPSKKCSESISEPCASMQFRKCNKNGTVTEFFWMTSSTLRKNSHNPFMRSSSSKFENLLQ